MWTYHALILAAACTLLAVTTEVRGYVCQEDDFLQVQETCRQQNEELLNAEGDHEHGMVCKSLFDLWRCVALNVPGCLLNLTDIYKKYVHSPHNCAPTHDLIIELQNLTMTGEKYDEKPGGEVDPEIIPLTVTPSFDASTTLAREDGGLENVTNGDVEKGGQHKHTAGNGVQRLQYCGLSAVVMAWLLQITPYLLHS